MRHAALAILTAFLVVPAANARTSASGLRGVVMRGPITPMCVAEQPCDAPARGFTVAFSRSGNVVGRTATDSDGRYRIRLAPGRYTVRIGRGGAFKRPEPDVVRVRADVLRRVDFHVDTGIE